MLFSLDAYKLWTFCYHIFSKMEFSTCITLFILLNDPSSALNLMVAVIFQLLFFSQANCFVLSIFRRTSYYPMGMKMICRLLQLIYLDAVNAFLCLLLQGLFQVLSLYML